MFDGIAGRYDLLNTLISLGLHKRWKRAAAKIASVPPDGLALDVCAGTGDIAVALAERGARAVCVDFSQEMIARGRARTARLRISYVQGDALLLPFPDDAFDAATIGFSLRNVSSRPRLFAEMARVVRPGGTVVALEASRPANSMVRVCHRAYLTLAAAAAGLIADRDAYRYLAASILSFPSPEEVAGEMAEAGLAEVCVRRFALGAAALYWGVKPRSPQLDPTASR